MQERVLVLGLGNPILTDDAVGLLVAREVRQRIGSGVHVAEASVAGFDLIEAFSGYDRVIVIDSIRTPGGSPGAVYLLASEDLPATERLTGAHEIDLATAIALGRRLGLHMPHTVRIVAVEVQDNRTFGESCTPEVARSIDSAVELVLDEILFKSRRLIRSRIETCNRGAISALQRREVESARP
ncbi:MAG: hydrogenase maturation protease [Acidobacteriota bacterium]